jgi:hypothetical protein
VPDRHPEVAKPAGGDRRSIGRSPEVVARILADPALFDPVFDAIGDDDPVIRMRAADAVEKVTVRRPDLLRSHAGRLLELAGIDQQEVRMTEAASSARAPRRPSPSSPRTTPSCAGASSRASKDLRRPARWRCGRAAGGCCEPSRLSNDPCDAIYALALGP